MDQKSATYFATLLDACAKPVACLFVARFTVAFVVVEFCAKD